jgi:hypothetical protein
MSNILIVGHCKPGPESPHDPLYEFKGGANYPLQGVDYLDTMNGCPKQEGQFHVWDDVSRNSKDILYPWNCPLYLGVYGAFPLYADGKQMWLNLLVDGYDILKPGGRVIIPTMKDIIPLPQRGGRLHILKDSAEQQLKNVERIIADFAPGKWCVKYMHTSMFILSDKPQRKPNYPCLILEKI